MGMMVTPQKLTKQFSVFAPLESREPTNISLLFAVSYPRFSTLAADLQERKKKHNPLVRPTLSLLPHNWISRRHPDFPRRH
jgi:hypothetical protein